MENAVTETSIEYVLEGLAWVGTISMLASLSGIVVVFSLLRRASQIQGTIHVAIIDVGCLAAIVGTLSTLIWNLFPGGDKTDGMIYVLTGCLVAFIYQMFVVPCAFVAPSHFLLKESSAQESSAQTW